MILSFKNMVVPPFGICLSTVLLSIYLSIYISIYLSIYMYKYVSIRTHTPKHTHTHTQHQHTHTHTNMSKHRPKHVFECSKNAQLNVISVGWVDGWVAKVDSGFG